MRSNRFFTCMVLLLLIGCSSEMEVGQMESLPGSWTKDEVVAFRVPQLDSLQAYNLFIHVRNTNDYPFNNLFLIASIEFPHGKTIQDTLEYRMARPDGSWLGTGIGSVKENKLWYKEGVRFFEPGEYTLRLSHAMRNNGEVLGVSTLPGITEVGYSIEKSPD